MQLRIDEVEFDRGSVVDPAGKVFHYEGRVFRAIAPEFATLYQELVQSDGFDELVRAGLIETWVSDIRVEGYDLVLEHRKIPFLSQWSEWCSAMVKDAAAMVCRLHKELSSRGLMLKDTQPGNVQFIQGKACWIDFGSIVAAERHQPFHFSPFRYNYALPLWLISKGRRDLGRAVFCEIGQGYLKKKYDRRRHRLAPVSYWLMGIRASSQNISRRLARLSDWIDQLEVEPTGNDWTDYGQGGMPSVHQPEEFGEKAAAVHRLLEAVEPGTLLDMAGNKGWYAELAASMGHRVVCFDADDASICRLYHRLKDGDLPILPLVLDFRYPTPPFSIGLGKASAFDRLSCDTVLALAIVHHLVFTCHLFFEPIADIIARYTRKQAIIEFVPVDDVHVRKWVTPRHRWYTLDNFLKVLSRHFVSCEVHDSSPSPRKLIVCRKASE